MNLRALLVQQIIAVSLVISVTSEEPWDFLVMTDWHGAELYSRSPVIGEPGEADTWYKTQRLSLQDIHKQYGGDLVILPGDTNGGKWYSDEWREKFSPQGSPEHTVLKAGTNCYKTVKNLFSQSGYDKILVAIGDRKCITYLIWKTMTLYFIPVEDLLF